MNLVAFVGHGTDNPPTTTSKVNRDTTDVKYERKQKPPFFSCLFVSRHRMWRSFSLMHVCLWKYFHFRCTVAWVNCCHFGSESCHKIVCECNILEMILLKKNIDGDDKKAIKLIIIMESLHSRKECSNQVLHTLCERRNCMSSDYLVHIYDIFKMLSISFWFFVQPFAFPNPAFSHATTKVFAHNCLLLFVCFFVAKIVGAQVYGRRTRESN